jgi:hypothetical protein
MASLKKNSSGDQAGNYYTGTPDDLYSVSVPAGIGSKYMCPGTSAADGNSTPNFGPFTGSEFSAAKLGPIGSNKVWTPFAAWNQQQTVLPLPHTIVGTQNGLQFSKPPVFNFGNDYIAQLPNDDTQPPVQYYGNSQSDFTVAPATDPQTPITFILPAQNSDTPFTQLEGFSDWAATASLASESGQLIKVTFANGSPLAFLEFNTQYAWFRPATSIPAAFWYPADYTPAGVQISAGGAFPVTSSSAGTELSVEYDGTTASYTTQEGDTNQSVIEALRLACQKQLTMLNVSPTQSGSDGSYYFVLSAQSGSGLTTSEVTVAPTAKAPNVLLEMASVINPTGEIVGITITGQAQAQSGSITYYSSYLLIAPSNSQWTLQNGGAELVCQFQEAQGGTIIVVAMPDVSDEAYVNYYTPVTGAAAILQDFWEVMSPFAYGCPRHLDNDGNDDGTGTRFGPNQGNRFTPEVTTAHGSTTVTTEFFYNLTYPLGQPGDANGTLFGLFPHQWRAYANNPVTPLRSGENELTYQTVMGTLKLCGGAGFRTSYTFPGILAALPNPAQVSGEEQFNVYDYAYPKGQGVIAKTLSDQMAQDVSYPVWSANNFGASSPGVGGKKPAQNGFIPAPPSYQQNWGLDSYDWGKYVGGIGDLIQPALLMKKRQTAQAAISQLNAQLGQWLSGGLLYADSSTPFPHGVQPWQTEQGNTTFAGDTGVNSNQQFLYYDSQWRTFIPYPTGYGADTLINDHHFHYGYWLRAASQLALAQAMNQDPANKPGTLIANYGATVNLIVKDIANPLRADHGTVGDSATNFPNGPATPFLRYFDGYFGHSWASGLPFNILNQESLSEAMSAWTGIIMWGELTGDTSLRDLGIWMYTHEMFSFYEYWMDCAQRAASGSTLFPEGSARNIVGDAYAESIKGGLAAASVGFCTQVYNSYLELTSFFGMDPLFLTGIEWLPFHGGSFYLSSTDPAVNETLKAVFSWAQGNSQYQWKSTNNGQSLPFYQPTYFAVSWEPVAWNHAATIRADTAANIWAELEDAIGSSGGQTQYDGWKPLGGESVSYSYYWIHNMSTLGSRDATVSADYPFAVKFLNSTTAPYYVVWNLTNESKTVTFSDGQSVSDVPPYSMKIFSGAEEGA